MGFLDFLKSNQGKDKLLQVELLFKQALANYESGDFQNCNHEISKAITLDPNNPYLYYFRGNSKEDLHDYLGCIEDMQKYISFNPYYQYNGWYRIGICFQSLKKWEEAISAYSKAIEFYKPFDSDKIPFIPLQTLMKTIIKMNEIQNKADSGDYFRVRLDRIYNNRAVSYSNIKKSDDVISDCSKAIEINPNYPNPYYVRGIEYLKQKNSLGKNDLIKAANLGYKPAIQLYNELF